MPSIAAHMVCAKLVADKLKIEDSAFVKGNLLPDIIDILDSHKKIQGKLFLIPDINYFIKIFDLNNNLCLGYLTHLLLDKLFLENYLCSNCLQKDIFTKRYIYKDYDIINYKLLKKFGVDVKYLNCILKDFNVLIDKTKYQANIDYLNKNSSKGTLNCLDFEKFSTFLIDSANEIVKYLEEVKR